MKTVNEISETLTLHHIASRRGCISRKTEGRVEEYAGDLARDTSS